MRWRSQWLAYGWFLFFLIVYLSLRPGEPLLPPSISDKLQHVLAYGVLTYWFSCLYQRFPTRLACAAGFSLLGAVLECIQGWTGYRTFDYADMVADILGVVLGWLAAPPRVPSLPLVIERLASRAGYN